MVAVLLAFLKTPAALNLIRENNFCGGTSAAVTKVLSYLAGTAMFQRFPEWQWILWRTDVNPDSATVKTIGLDALEVVYKVPEVVIVQFLGVLC